MAIKDDMEDVQEAVINELITENGITNTLADGQVTESKIANGAVTAAKLGSDVSLTPADGSITPAKLDRAYLESTGGSVSGNVNVTGTVTADGLTVDGATPSIRNSTSPAAFTIGASNGASSNLILKGAAGMEMQTYNGGWKKYFNLAYTGDISFYEDTGTTAKLFWDASAERLAIQNTNPAASLHVAESSSGLTARFSNQSNQTLDIGTVSGVGAGGSVYIDNANSGNIQFRTGGTERMRIQADGTIKIANSSEPSTPSGGGVLYVQNGALKFKGSSGTVTTIANA